MESAHGAPIVVFGDDWGRHVSTMQHIFRRVAEQRLVIWVNAVGHRVPRFNWADSRRALQKLGNVVWRTAPTTGSSVDLGRAPHVVVHPRVLPWHHYASVRALNTWSLIRDVKSALTRAGASDPPVLVTGSPPTADVVGRLGEQAAVYFCMDDFLHLPNVTPWMLAPLESRLLKRVDAVVATARQLIEVKKPERGCSYYLPQGVNYDHFARPRPLPHELKGLPRPRIGFAGALTTPVDLALIRHVAQSNPSGSVILVGPVAVSRDALNLPNIHVLGPRAYIELPGYVQGFDVGLIPYVLNEHTVAVDPLKLLEYLAAGIPVVSTDLPEVRKYRSVTAIAERRDDFVAAVHAAVADPAAGAVTRQALARNHDWEQRAKTLLGILAEVVSRRSSRHSIGGRTFTTP